LLFFDDRADFSGARFGSLAFFAREPKKGGTSKSTGAIFKEAKFDHARFESDAHFDNAMFQGPASFRAATFRAVYFSPSGMAGGSQQFLGDLDLLGCTYDRIQLEWQSLLRYPNGQSRIRPYDRQPFIELEGALRKTGEDEQANAVFLERRRIERSSLMGLAWLVDCLYWLGANYGTSLSPEFIILVVLIGFGIITFTRAGALKARNGSNKNAERATIPQAVFLTIHSFLPLELPAKPRWEPASPMANFYANLVHILGWIIVPLSVAVLYSFLHRAP